MRNSNGKIGYDVHEQAATQTESYNTQLKTTTDGRKPNERPEVDIKELLKKKKHMICLIEPLVFL